LQSPATVFVGRDWSDGALLDRPMREKKKFVYAWRSLQLHICSFFFGFCYNKLRDAEFIRLMVCALDVAADIILL